MNKQGFTLIELMVVVLIVGILAAVAIPQYERSVDKARVMELVSMIDSLEKAVKVYRNEHDGNLGAGDIVRYLNVKYEGFNKLGDSYYCNTEKVCFSANPTEVSVGQYPDGFNGSTGTAEYILYSSYANSKWNRDFADASRLGLAGMSLDAFGFSQR